MATAHEGLPSDLLQHLAEGLTRLPGSPGQGLMAPRPQNGPLPPRDARGATPAAALLALYPRKGTTHFLLTVRSSQLPLHRGQVSLPGGLCEEDETLVEAALREAQEEVGLDPDRVSMIGPLSPLFIPPTRFLLHPFVATTSTSPRWRPSPAEVERILEVRLDDLLSPANHRHEVRTLHGERYVVPYFALEGEKVWGATAMILAEFLTALGEPPRRV